MKTPPAGSGYRNGEFSATPHAYLKINGRQFLLVGQSNANAGNISYKPDSLALAIELPVGAQSLLIPGPVSELTNQVLELPAEAFGLNIAASDPQVQFRLVKTYLASRYAQRPDLALAQRLIILVQDNFELRVSQLAELAGYSTRQLQRIFLAYTGFATKEFVELCRFNHSLQNLSGPNSLRGYYDQSHFIRDFRRFSGYSPGEYRDSMSDLYNRSLASSSIMGPSNEEDEHENHQTIGQPRLLV